MEILFVTHKYPPAVGGMEKQSLELIRGMQKIGKVHTLVYTGAGSRIGFFLSLEKKIMHMLAEFPAISIIHFNDALLASVCLRHKRYQHLRRAVTVHGLDIVFPSKIYQKYVLPCFNRFDLIIAVSQATANACMERGIDKKKVVVICNGVDHSLLQKNATHPEIYPEYFKAKHLPDLKGKTILLAMGRPVKRKGFSWFIEKVLPGLHEDFLLLIAGPFNPKRSWQDLFWNFLPLRVREKIQLFAGYHSDENRLRSLLKDKTRQNKVLHLGKLPQQELEQLLHFADAFIMPNIAVTGDMEGFGLVCLEASLAGSWVFASEIDGITSAVHPGKNGTLLTSGNPQAWIQALNRYIDDPSGFISDAEPAQYTARTFSWQTMVHQYHRHFQALHVENKP